MLGDSEREGETERNRRWASTMVGYADHGTRYAHADSHTGAGPNAVAPFDRLQREDLEDAQLAPGATRARGPGNRVFGAKDSQNWRCRRRKRRAAL